MSHNFEVGELLQHLTSGTVALVVERRLSGRHPNREACRLATASLPGDEVADSKGRLSGQRVLYRLRGLHKETWKHDIQAHSEYKRLSPLPR